MENDGFRRRCGLDELSRDEIKRHEKRLIFMDILDGEKNITSPPKLIRTPNRTFKKKEQFVFTPIPIPEMEKITFEQVLECDPYIRKLKDAFEYAPTNV